MDSDRELLEKAAKAVGLEISCWDQHDGIEFAWLIDGTPWQPLHENRMSDCMGDALRLAVKLRLDIMSFDQGAEVCMCPGTVDDPFGETLAVERGDDLCAATRRAIVRAAAALGDKDA